MTNSPLLRNYDPQTAELSVFIEVNAYYKYLTSVNNDYPFMIIFLCSCYWLHFTLSVVWGWVMMVKVTMIAVIVPTSCLPPCMLVLSLPSGPPAVVVNWMNC